MSLPFASLNAATAAGPGVFRDLERLSRHVTMFVSCTGSPSAGTVALEGSHDGVNWVNLFSQSVSSGPVANTVSTHWVRHVRANLTTLTGGTSPTVTASIAIGDEQED